MENTGENKFNDHPGCNLVGLIASDLREYLDFKIREWEVCLTHDNEALERSARILRHAIWNAILENDPVYLKPNFAMPPKIQEMSFYSPGLGRAAK